MNQFLWTVLLLFSFPFRSAREIYVCRRIYTALTFYRLSLSSEVFANLEKVPFKTS